MEKNYRPITVNDIVCELPTSVRALYIGSLDDKVTIFGVSHDKNYTFVWDGVSKFPERFYTEWKHKRDLYKEYRP
jgi:hypothetical protein